MTDCCTPSDTTVVGFAVTVDRVALIAPTSAMNCTVGCWVSTASVPETLVSTETVTVFTSAFREKIRPVATPPACVVGARRAELHRSALDRIAIRIAHDHRNGGGVRSHSDSGGRARDRAGLRRTHDD